MVDHMDNEPKSLSDLSEQLHKYRVRQVMADVCGLDDRFERLGFKADVAGVQTALMGRPGPVITVPEIQRQIEAVGISEKLAAPDAVILGGLIDGRSLPDTFDRALLRGKRVIGKIDVADSIVIGGRWLDIPNAKRSVIFDTNWSGLEFAGDRRIRSCLLMDPNLKRLSSKDSLLTFNGSHLVNAQGQELTANEVSIVDGHFYGDNSLACAKLGLGLELQGATFAQESKLDLDGVTTGVVNLAGATIHEEAEVGLSNLTLSQSNDPPIIGLRDAEVNGIVDLSGSTVRIDSSNMKLGSNARFICANTTFVDGSDVTGLPADRRFQAGGSRSGKNELFVPHKQGFAKG